jgi:site-specific recombinase XerD
MPTPPTNKGRKLPPEPLTRAEVRDLIAAASNQSTSGVRMRALIAAMVGAGLRLALARLKRRAGIAKRVHPHRLRHSLAFDLAQPGIPMHAIQAQLRHASLAHTDRYVRHLMPAEVIALMRQRTWEEEA